MSEPILKFRPACGCHLEDGLELTPVEPWIDYQLEKHSIKVILVHRPACRVCGKSWRTEEVKK